MKSKSQSSLSLAQILKQEKSSFLYKKVASQEDQTNDNCIIHGENLRSLQLLLPYIENKVKCIYIDPPYNNRDNFTHYSDNKSHETWLNEISDRICILRNCLREDGSLWISVDDNEAHYLKVAADLIFGRKNFVSTIIWQQRTTRENRKIFSNNHEYILVYAKDKNLFKKVANKLAPSDEILARYKNPDHDRRGPWQSISANVQDGHSTKSQHYTLISPNGKKHHLPPGRCWVYTKEKMLDEIKKNNIWLGRDGSGVPRIKKFLQNSTPGVTPQSFWPASEVGTTDLAKKEIIELISEELVFDTPKPEKLIKRIIEIATNPGDLVLDAYLGSGTTAATAHKLGRRYIGIEMGSQIKTHAMRRLKLVCEGEQTGISQEVNWAGGSGFHFFTLKK
jgi:adenine-specific DNA-methyltransferase